MPVLRTRKHQTQTTFCLSLFELHFFIMLESRIR